LPSFSAILELGAWTGTIYSGVMAERISRKYTILVNVIMFCIGVIIQCCSAVGNERHILAGRFITGMGVGRSVYLLDPPAPLTAEYGL
jgi:MFS family permease